MKKDELKVSSITELQKSLKEARKELINLRAENAQRKLKNVKSIAHKKKEIASILTFIRAKELTNAG
ncbi:MAG TPA: 50S ribosomal protein L29 [Candidatus Nanoarchaeia archaeon]|nr:50S ribosomal protein L29 [uncultured archaeon]